MPIHTGTEDDDEFVVTSTQQGDQYHGLGGQDSIVLPGVVGGFTSLIFNSLILDSIEHLVFTNPAGSNVYASFDLLNNPWAAPGATVTGSAGNNQLLFITTTSGDFTVPDLTLLDWADSTYGFNVSISTTSATGSILRANADLASMQSLSGGSGNDTLIGHDGADTILGGLGNDTMTGLGGDDSFGLYNYDLSAFLPDDPDQSGDSIDGGEGEDFMIVGGPIIAPDSIVGVEHIEFATPAPGLISPAELILFTSLHSDFLANANFIGNASGTVTLNFDTVPDFDGSAITFDDLTVNGLLIESNAVVTFAFVGNDNDNSITGTSRADTIDGGDGGDLLEGGEGDDELNGGDGFDTASFASAAVGVTVKLWTDNTYQVTGVGNDTLTGFEGVLGSSHDDKLQGNGGDNILEGGLGDDVLDGSQGNDTLIGGGGSDTASYNGDHNYAVTIDLSIAGSQDTGTQGTDTLIGIENLIGSNLADILTGNSGDNVINGWSGSDMLIASGGNDTLDGGGGGQGTDLVDFSNAPSGVVVSLADAAPQVTALGSATLLNIDGLIGTSFDDQLTGNQYDNVLYGAAGADWLIGGGNHDQLDGGEGADMLFGGTGNDIFYVNTQADLVFENAGEGTEDEIVSSVSLYLYANVEELRLELGAGDLFGVGNGLDNWIAGNEGSNLLIGGDGNDHIYGDDGIDNLFGEAGNDELYGGTGIDYLVGGEGNDTLEGGTDPDALHGGEGNDTLEGGWGFFTDILVGSEGDDVLYGDSEMQDYDLMDGGAGNDSYYVDTGADLTFEAEDGGTDTVYALFNGPNYGVYLYANVENLVLIGVTTFGVGNELANEITGNYAANWLIGGAGDDTLNGKVNNDVLFGEAGSDTFVFEHGTGGDVIGDFVHGQDEIDISDFDFASFAALQTTFVQNGAHGAINLGNGDFIVLHNVTMASLDAGDFVL